MQSQDGDGRLADRQLTLTPQGGSVANVAQVQPTYDAAGNVATLTTSLAAIPGVAGTGGNETQAILPMVPPCLPAHHPARGTIRRASSAAPGQRPQPKRAGYVLLRERDQRA